MGVSTSFRRSIMAFLNTQQFDLLDHWRESDWNNNLRWLDRSGLALPLAAKLETLDASRIPNRMKDLLHVRLLDNGKRMKEMLGWFKKASDALTRSGVRYCCVKGVSLIPDCFESIRERHQVDLDFLISPQDAERAQAAIDKLGYRMAEAEASGEMRFTKRWRKHLGVDAYLYQIPEAPPIELHTRVWEPEVDAIEFPDLPRFLDAIESHEVAGVRFPRLKPSQQFVYLLLHIFRHLLGSWCRPLSLYEVATLIRRYGQEEQLWAEVSQIIRHDDHVASACALVLGVVRLAFPTSLPQQLEDLLAQHQSMESSLWLENYADDWLFSDPPGTKLALLVQKQFCSNNQTWRQYIHRRLLPRRSAPSLCNDESEAARTLAYRAEQMRYSLSRVWYHLRSDCQYLIARFRWEKLLHVREF